MYHFFPRQLTGPLHLTTTPALIGYQRALKELARLNATPHDFAMWCCEAANHRPTIAVGKTEFARLDAYDKHGAPFDLRAYLWSPDSHHEDGPESRYIAALERIYFDAEEIRSFVPATRWLTYFQLHARWTQHVADATAFIAARVQDGDLRRDHPLSICSESTVDALYRVSEIEKVEVRHLSIADATKKTGAGNARGAAECQRWLLDLMANGEKQKAKPGYLKEAKEKFFVSERSFIQVWAEASAQTQHRWSQSGRRKSKKS